MATKDNLPLISAAVAIESSLVQLALQDRRPDALSLFEATPEEFRSQLAQDAWVIGLRALKNAHSQAQEARLQDVGKSLLDDVDRELKSHLAQQQESVKRALAEYFDPQDGKLSERMAAFLNDEGVLGKVLERYLGSDNSVLAESLARQVGEHSPLFKKLSPTDSEGLIQVLSAKLTGVLEEQRADFGRALDPLEKDGAVGRFLTSLRGELESADADRAKQLSTALAALDANDESSLLSRLVRESEQARRSLLQSINPDVADSPMAVLKTALEGLLKEHAKTQHELLETQRVRQEKFERDVQAALARLETRREHEQKSPRGGLTFEAAVSSFVHEAVNGGPYVVDDTGSRVGARPGCKVGDVVVQFTADSAFDGSAIVIEAKQDRSYTVAKALSEMEIARSNRGAEAGVFVLAGMHAPNGFPPFARYGKDILVTWDCDDPNTDPYLRAALLTALGLASRQQKNADEGDIRALEDVAQRIEAEIARLGKMRSHNDKIRKGSDDIADEIRKGENKLDLLLRKAGEVLKALSVEVQDEQAERRSPITLPNPSMVRTSTPIESSDTAEIM